LEAHLAELRTVLRAEIVGKVMELAQPILEKRSAAQAASIASVPARDRAYRSAQRFRRKYLRR